MSWRRPPTWQVEPVVHVTWMTPVSGLKIWIARPVPATSPLAVAVRVTSSPLATWSALDESETAQAAGGGVTGATVGGGGVIGGGVTGSGVMGTGVIGASVTGGSVAGGGVIGASVGTMMTMGTVGGAVGASGDGVANVVGGTAT